MSTPIQDSPEFINAIDTVGDDSPHERHKDL